MFSLLFFFFCWATAQFQPSPHLAWLPFTSDQLAARTANCTKRNTRYQQPHQRESNPQSHQSGDNRPTPYTTRVPGSAFSRPHVRSNCPISPPFRITCCKHLFFSRPSAMESAKDIIYVSRQSVNPIALNQFFLHCPTQTAVSWRRTALLPFWQHIFPHQSSSQHIGLPHKLTNWHHVWWMFDEQQE